MGTLSRVLTPFLIIAVPIAAVIAYLGYHHHTREKTPPAAAFESGPVAFGTPEWPVFRGNAAFTGTAAGTLPNALKPAWQFQTAAAVKSTPAVAQETVFISSLDDTLYAVDLKTGQEKWRFKADDELEASPLCADGTVFVGSANGTFYAVSAESGQSLWTFTTSGKILGSANHFTDASGNACVIFGSYDNYLYCLKAQNGELIWKHEAQSYINGAPAIADGKAVFGSCDGRVYIVPLIDPNTTQTIDIETYMAASPAIADGFVFAGNYEGLFIAASLSSRTPLWQFRRKNVPFISSPAVTEDRVLFGAQDNNLYCLNRTDGKLLWTFSSTDKIDSSPVVCGDKVIFGADNGRLTMANLADGKEVFTYTLGQPITAGVAIAENTVLVGCDDGVVYAFTPQ